MHSFPTSEVTKFKAFPRAHEVQPRREPRRSPAVGPEDVPENLKSVPGSPRDKAQENFFGRHFPEPNFKMGRLTETYHKVVEAAPGKVGETYRILVEKYGDLIPRVNAAAYGYHELPAAPAAFFISDSRSPISVVRAWSTSGRSGLSPFSIPFQTTSLQGTQTTFVDANLELNVTPQITSRDPKEESKRILMRVRATRNAVGARSNPAGPSIDRREATTQVIVRDGETMVIGGVFVDTQGNNVQGVPYLSRMPVLGWLFKNKSETVSKQELLIFLTPRITKS